MVENMIIWNYFQEIQSKKKKEKKLCCGLRKAKSYRKRALINIPL